MKSAIEFSLLLTLHLESECFQTTWGRWGHPTSTCCRPVRAATSSTLLQRSPHQSLVFEIFCTCTVQLCDNIPLDIDAGAPERRVPA